MKRLMIVLSGLVLAMGVARADVVAGLDPNGDNFLSLRTGPGSGYAEIDRMGPGTEVQVIGSHGGWRHIRLRNGMEGWAFGQYIAPDAPETSEAPPAAPPDESQSANPPDTATDAPPGGFDGSQTDDNAPTTGGSGETPLPPPDDTQPNPDGGESDPGQLE